MVLVIFFHGSGSPVRVSRKWLIGFRIEWGLSRGVDRALAEPGNARRRRARTVMRLARRIPAPAALTHHIITVAACDAPSTETNSFSLESPI